MRLILASASPRRRELLAAAGVHFLVDPVAADETLLAGESGEGYVERVARLKAAAGQARHPQDAVLGADTTVVVDGEILAKPADAADATRMLRLLSGRAHEVFTGVALGWPGGLLTRVEHTRVSFAALSPEDIAWYVQSGEPADRAGAYAIQGLASRFVQRIEGSYTNVVGLPVAAVLQLLAAAGLNAEPVSAPPDGRG